MPGAQRLKIALLSCAPPGDTVEISTYSTTWKVESDLCVIRRRILCGMAFFTYYTKLPTYFMTLKYNKARLKKGSSLFFVFLVRQHVVPGFLSRRFLIHPLAICHHTPLPLFSEIEKKNLPCAELSFKQTPRNEQISIITSVYKFRKMMAMTPCIGPRRPHGHAEPHLRRILQHLQRTCKR